MKRSISLTGRRNQRGQGMTEYIIIVALIAIAAIGVFTFFGQTVRSQVSGIATELSGQDASGQIGKAKQAANNSDQQTKKKGMSEYNGNGN